MGPARRPWLALAVHFEEAPMSTTSPTQLSYDVVVSDGPPRAGDQRTPDGTLLAWSPLSSTLIFGAQDALLVDPALHPHADPGRR